MFHSIFTTFKGAFSGINKTIWFLSLAMLINRSGTMVIIFMTVYATQSLHFSIEQAGTIMSMFGIGSLIGVFLGGKLSDMIGFNKVMYGSLLLGAVFLFLLAQVESFKLFAFCTLLVSLFGEAFRPANTAAIGTYSKPENFTRSLSLNRLATNLGFSVGPALGGLLAQHNFSDLFYADAISSVLAAFIIILFVSNKKHLHKPVKDSEIIELKNISPFADVHFMIFIGFTILYTTAFFQMFSTMPLYYKDVHHLSARSIGFLMAMNGILVAATEMILIYKIEHKFKPLQFVVFGAAALVLNYLLLLGASNLIWLVFSMLLVTLSEMLAMPFMMTFMISRANKNNKGRYAALYSMTWSIAQIASPIIATQTISNFGFDVLWLLYAFFSFLVLVGMFFLHKKVSLVYL